MSLTDAPARIAPIRQTGHIGKPTHHLHDFVERQAVLIGARQVAFQRAIDDLRRETRDGLVVEPGALEQAGAKIFDQHVAVLDQASRDRLPFR